LGTWQGRLDHIFVPWLKRNIPDWKSEEFSEIEEIAIQTNSSYIFAGRRLLGLINWFMQETTNEFIFITTTSSLINLKVLERTIMNYDANAPVYSGNLLGESGTGFISGAGQLINRKTAEIILENFKAYPHRMLNDVALAHLLSRFGIKPEHKPWLWIRSVQEAREVQLDECSNIFHFRLKSETHPRVDHQMMKIIHDRLCEMNEMNLTSY
jgi:hypothetical protein